MTIELLQGDCLEVVRDMADGSYTACLCDPPYGLKFMGKAWDRGVPGVPYWAEVLRVLAPGAVLMAFGGTRTFHRLACAIEDAGFEIADTIMWVYGSGFPKSHDISKGIDKAAGAEREVGPKRVSADGTVAHDGSGKRNEGWERPWRDDPEAVDRNTRISYPSTPDAVTWDGWGTALKPSFEPVIVARKPRGGLTYAECAVRYGTGALWIDGGRIGYINEDPPDLERWRKTSGGWKNTSTAGVVPNDNSKGRWPANLIHDGSDEVLAGMPNCKAGVAVHRNGVTSNGVTGWGKCPPGTPDVGYGDSGSASRFFYCAKASRAERDAGLDGWDARVLSVWGGDEDDLSEGKKAIRPSRNHHPCCKPLALTEYLAKLLRPPEAYLDSAALLVPFAGVGSEMIGAIRAGWRNVTGIELDAEYAELGRARLAHWQAQCAPQLELALATF